MLKTYLRFAFLAGAAQLLPACAQLLSAAAPPVSHDPKAADAGEYAVEPYHTQVIFSVVHMGFSNFYGNFSGASGVLTYLPNRPGSMSVSVSVPTASVATTSPQLDVALKGSAWLDAARYPNMLFRSSAVVQTGPNTADVAGTLSLHGVSRPLTLHAMFIGTGVNLLTHKKTIGFQLSGTLKRSDFGVDRFVPLISDEVSMTIAAAFEKS
jgi:polyisoprenoid-binding protein YceI